MRTLRLFVASAIVFLLVGCVQQDKASEKNVQFLPHATLQDIMLHVIDPNVDALWNAVTTIVSKEGVQEVRPTTEEEWRKLQGHAVTLQEAANLLLIRGRKVAVETASTSIHPVELGPVEIEKAIQADRALFDQYAKDLHVVSGDALAAIVARDVNALEQVGGLIEHACEQCHAKFWYPADQRPTAQNDLGLQSKNALYLKLRAS